jgi:hypothetical protein
VDERHFGEPELRGAQINASQPKGENCTIAAK